MWINGTLEFSNERKNLREKGLTERMMHLNGANQHGG